ncbi:hypothetical protein SAMN04488085_109215 [Geodermatophilus ruber]|uniref:Uncharacterized protein n=1 Tax=Geodermatophilus ruber TaxID=504800 RepID=A0A1I4GY01_9ACTN|nr:hypothetical protein SAMN04488085_109215 [Geodermatophilus ruber]
MERTSPEVARRTWPRWLAGGIALLLVAVVAVFWSDGGDRLLLGIVGAAAAVRGAIGTTRPPARRAALVIGGLAAVGLALASAPLSGWVLLAGVPAALLTGALVLLGRGGAVRRSGQAGLVWTALLTGVLVVTGIASSWERAAGGAAVAAALGVGLVGVFLLVNAVNLRAVAVQPPAPARPSACAGCACGAGGCGVRA